MRGCLGVSESKYKMFSMGPMHIPVNSSILLRDTRNFFDTAGSNQGICICICVFIPCISKLVSITILLI